MIDWSTLPRDDGHEPFGTILLDPPWHYEQDGMNSPYTRGTAEKHYTTMALEEIAAIPIQEIAAKDAIVWLWTTNTHLHEAFHVLEEWGAHYRTTATWCKTQFGLGFWLRGQTEHLLLATFGHPRGAYRGPHGTMASAWSTWIVEKRRGHSEKPRKAYAMIEALSPEPRIEIFARARRAGWICWGNELSSTVQETLG